MFKSWRQEQLEQARLRHSPRSVYHPPAISQTSSVVTKQSMTIATEPMLKTNLKEVPVLSLCAPQALLDTPWGPSMEFRQLARRGKGRSMGTLHTPQKPAMEGVQKKKTTKMLQEYRAYARMPKGWAMMEIEDKEVAEVWEMQRRALSDSITRGPLTRLEYR